MSNPAHPRFGSLAMHLAAVTTIVLLGSGKTAVAGDGVGYYLEPSIGYAFVKVSSLEIETSFVKNIDAGDGTDPGDLPYPDQVDPDAATAPVGRKTGYAGGGLAVGVATGISLFDLDLGVSYSWANPTMDGYSKRYTYMPEKMRAGGRRFLDTGSIDLHRIMAQMRYRLPLWRFTVMFQTRIGSIFLDDGPLILGRSVNKGKGFVGDVGLGLHYEVADYLSVGVDWAIGLFSFSGDYEGAYGTINGVNGLVSLHL